MQKCDPQPLASFTISVCQPRDYDFASLLILRRFWSHVPANRGFADKRPIESAFATAATIVFLDRSLFRPAGILMSRRAIIYLIAALVLSAGPVAIAEAGPPAYLMLRRPESPKKHYQPGYPDAAMLDARTSGYAYGFFGVAPRSHASRHFGINRTYTQWSLW